MIDNVSIAIHTFVLRMLILLLVDKLLLSKYENKFTYLRGLLLKVKIAISCFKPMSSVLFVYT